EQRPAGGITTECKYHSFGAPFRNLDRCGQCEGHADELRSAAFGQPCHARIERDCLAACKEAGPQCYVEALRKSVIKRQHVVFCRFCHEQVLQFAKSRRLLLSEIDRLAEVFRDVVQLPLIVVEARLACSVPRKSAVTASWNP